MPATYEPIASTTVSGTSTNSVSFSSIPGTFTDLVFVWTGTQTTTSRTDVNIRFNSDTGGNYSQTWLQGTGSATDSGRLTSQDGLRVVGYPSSANIMTSRTQIMSYANTSVNKTTLTSRSDSGFAANVAVGLWRSTAAITSMTVYISANNFADGSTFALYGIKAA